MRTKQPPILALRITGQTINKLAQKNPSLWDFKVREIWNHYFVQNVPMTIGGSTNRIMSPAEFHDTFEWVSGKQPRYLPAPVKFKAGT